MYSLGIIDVAAEWASDLKEGSCPGDFYYDKDSCCWLSNETFREDGSCSSWHTWAEQAGIHSRTSIYFVNYMIYIIFAVGFGGMAGLFVTLLAPYAAGSGIPEVMGEGVCVIDTHVHVHVPRSCA